LLRSDTWVHTFSTRKIAAITRNITVNNDPKLIIQRKCDENRNFRQKSKFWRKILILGKNPNFRQKSKSWPKIQIWGKNQNFG